MVFRYQLREDLMVERRQFWRIVSFEHFGDSVPCLVQPYTERRVATTFSVISVGAECVGCRSYGARDYCSTGSINIPRLWRCRIRPFASGIPSPRTPKAPPFIVLIAAISILG